MATAPRNTSNGSTAAGGGEPAAPDRALQDNSASSAREENIVQNNPQLNEEEVRYLQEMLAIARRSRRDLQPQAARKQAALAQGDQDPATELDKQENERRKKLLNEPQTEADAQAQKIASLPPEWRDKLVSQNDKYFLRNDPQSAVFRASDSELATKLNSPEVAKLLAATADERGWANIKVKGTAAFRREVFVEATARGIQVSGYKGTEVDYQEAALRSRQFEDRNRITADRQAVRNLTPEAIAARNAGQSAEAVAIASTEQYLNSSTADPTSRRLIAAAMRQKISEREPGETATINMKAPEGRLIAFGAAKYKFDNDLDPSYYATLERNNTQRTIWGKGLQEAIEQSEAREGDYVRFERGGTQAINVNSRIRDQKTKQVSIQQVSAQRQGWSADVLEKAPDQNQTRTRPRGRDDDLNQEMQR